MCPFLAFQLYFYFVGQPLTEIVMALAEGKLTLKKMYVVTQLLPGVFGHARSRTGAP